MERKKFIRSMTILAGTFPTLLYACSKSIGDAASSAGSVTEADSGSGNSACVEAPEETAGPFPSKTPASLVRSDITDGKTGYPLAIHITVSNSNNNCAALAGVIVDIWHCDSEGNYSEYGGTTMQQTDYESVHFLRGRQTTDDNGLVSFTSIFPGWYEGRATHIHVHVYNAAGNSLKISQIAFPEGSGTALALVNGYKKGMSGYTYNAQDNVFSDDKDGVEIATVTGNLTDGFVLTYNLHVPA